MTTTAAKPMNTQSKPGRAHAVAFANFALIKYWGKRDAKLNLPDVGSISITLDALWTRTRVELDPALEHDRFELDGQPGAPGSSRVTALLDRIREIGGSRLRANVSSRNNFPTGAGLASSASGFAALVTAADRAYGLGLGAARRSELARIGSGSAARSIFGGYVEMHRGRLPDGSDSIAEPRSEEHTSELQSLRRISYAVFCLKKKKPNKISDAPIDIGHTALDTARKNDH